MAWGNEGGDKIWGYATEVRGGRSFLFKSSVAVGHINVPAPRLRLARVGGQHECPRGLPPRATRRHSGWRGVSPDK